MRLTGVSSRAAVVSIFTADGVWQRAASPSVRLVHEAAGGISGAAGPGVAHVPDGPSRTGNGLGLQGRDLLHPGPARLAGSVAGLLGHVAFVAFRAAVLVIVAAHGLR